MIDEYIHSPLTEGVYYILLALCKPLHGYGIMQKVSSISSGRIEIGAGTLYGALNTLLKKSWIEPVKNEETSRKKVYLITDKGRYILDQELLRLEELLDNGKKIIKDIKI